MHLVMYPLMVNWAIAAYMLLGMALFVVAAVRFAHRRILLDRPACSR